ncbi:Arylsulfatase precursor [Maioricimonas rarisocia]|uniref:Arylsulfatase n=1 Tax=Maioricimonas rarisocia TaxID=2528026 RepID=A0A517ZDR1_9PLAN|nr:arylsulfatase [Maioricimonas rarisocia]QDU40613.1 Arylsulfatase precursor [Maioricimonas rarisocia]
MRTPRLLSVLGLLLTGLIVGVSARASLAAPPNVVLVITDDQGYGDIGAHGNEMIRTPNLDRLHGESVRLTDYHVDPTCSPTRSALMSGRYSTRTGVWHTIMGRSMMSTDELTLAEVFAENGYRAGMFGKWHLGDTYPLRPQDQGFQTVVHHGGGGVGQTPDWWGNDYFDDTYLHEDGTPEQFTGYCTDVWFDEALKFIESSREKPFFCYLSTNAPHGPYYVEQSYKQPYLDAGVPEPMASFYGMITNIDDNMGRLVKKLDELGLSDNTILIFTTDNGTAAGVARGRQQQNAKWKGFNAGMRGQKGSEYDGGHRVPFFLRWPAGDLHGGRDVDTLAAHVDVLPTLVDLCGIDKPKGPPIDGTSLVHVLKGSDEVLRDRTLVVHSQRIEYPEKWRKSAVMTENWRLVNGKELFDIQSDPGQNSNVASAHPQVVGQLRDAYEQWWTSLSPVFDEHVRIVLGAEDANPTSFTCHDWHAPQPQVPWHQGMIARNPEANGYWMVDVAEAGTYEFRLRMRPAGVAYGLPAGTAKVRVGDVEASEPIEDGELFALVTVELKAGPNKLQTWLDSKDGKSRGAYFVDVQRVE